MKALKKTLSLLAPAYGVLLWIAVWWILAAYLGKPLLLPTPLATVKKLFSLILTKEFLKNILFSIARITLGLVLATLISIPIALLTVRFPLFRQLLTPLLSTIKATPVVSVIFLLMLWLGRNSIPFWISFMMAFPIVWSNLHEGFCTTDTDLLEMASVFSVNKKDLFLKIKLPAAMPYLFAALHSAIALSWKAGVAAEVLALPAHAIGRAIFEGRLYLQTEELFAYTLTVILFSFLIERLALALLPRQKKQEEH